MKLAHGDYLIRRIIEDQYLPFALFILANGSTIRGNRLQSHNA